jgi:hypothetical protein
MNAPRIRLDIDATREKLGQLACGHAADALEGLLSEAVRGLSGISCVGGIMGKKESHYVPTKRTCDPV